MMSLNISLIYEKKNAKNTLQPTNVKIRPFTSKQTYMAMCEYLKILENLLKVKANKFTLAFQK